MNKKSFCFQHIKGFTALIDIALPLFSFFILIAI